MRRRCAGWWRRWRARHAELAAIGPDIRVSSPDGYAAFVRWTGAAGVGSDGAGSVVGPFVCVRQPTGRPGEDFVLGSRRLRVCGTSVWSRACLSTTKKDMFTPPPPPFLKPGYFTTAAVDNIDHEPSSSTATKSFHGSSITIEVGNFLVEQNDVDSSSLYLPVEYRNIFPTPGGKLEPPIYLQESSDTINCTNIESQGWLDKLSKFADDISVEDRLSFSGYFSNNRDLISMGITRCTLLPLIDEEIATPATIRHCMRIV